MGIARAGLRELVELAEVAVSQEAGKGAEPQREEPGPVDAPHAP
jgi:hypothetical protein